MSKLEVQVQGNDPTIWAKFAGKFKATIQDLLNLETEKETGKTVRDELGEYFHHLKEAGKAVLERPTLENVQIKAQIQKAYLEMEKVAIEKEILSIEARKKALIQTISEMKLMLIFAKKGVFTSIAQSTGDYDMIFFIEQAEVFLDAIQEWERGITDI